jgi:hypothetical protein
MIHLSFAVQPRQTIFVIAGKLPDATVFDAKTKIGNVDDVKIQSIRLARQPMKERSMVERPIGFHGL